MNPDLPPPNRAIGWYRFMLWMMPTCIALTNAFGLIWLSQLMKWRGNAPLLLWFIFNIATTMGIGFFHARMSQPPSRNLGNATATFVLLQILIIPALTCAVFFAFCLAGAY